VVEESRPARPGAEPPGQTPRIEGGRDCRDPCRGVSSRARRQSRSTIGSRSARRRLRPPRSSGGRLESVACLSLAYLPVAPCPPGHKSAATRSSRSSPPALGPRLRQATPRCAPATGARPTACQPVLANVLLQLPQRDFRTQQSTQAAPPPSSRLHRSLPTQPPPRRNYLRRQPFSVAIETYRPSTLRLARTPRLPDNLSINPASRTPVSNTGHVVRQHPDNRPAQVPQSRTARRRAQ